MKDAFQIQKMYFNNSNDLKNNQVFASSNERGIDSEPIIKQPLDKNNDWSLPNLDSESEPLGDQDLLEETHAEVVDFLYHLQYPENEPLFVRLIKGNYAKNIKIENWNDDESYRPLIDANNKGYDIFFTVNGQGTKKIDISLGKVFFTEIDDSGMSYLEQYKYTEEGIGREPTITAASGNKSLHSYYVLFKPVTADKWSELQENLLDHCPKFDKAVKDISRVLRLPGFIHQKSGKRSSIFNKTGNTYSYEELRNHFPSTKTKDIKESEKIAPTQSTNVKPLVTIKIDRSISDENKMLNDFAQKVLWRANLDNWNNKSILKQNQEFSVHSLACELAAATNQGYISEDDAYELGKEYTLSLINLDPENPWKESDWRKKFQRALLDDTLEYSKAHYWNEQALKQEKLNSSEFTLYQIAKNNGKSQDEIIKGILEGSIELENKDKNNDSIPTFIQFVSDWVKRVNTAIDKGEKSSTICRRSFENTLFDWIHYNVIDFRYEWKVNNQECHWDKFISDFQNYVLIYVKENNEADKDNKNEALSKFSKLYRISSDYSATLADYIQQTIKFNPITYWVENLPNWDGVDRYTPFLKNLSQEPEKVLSRAVLEYFKGILNRWLKPGTKQDLLLILKGKQGAKKSSFCFALHPKAGNSDSLDTNKDNLMLLHKCALVEIGELDGVTKKSEVEKIKNTISRNEDMFRVPYGKANITFPRSFSLMGTVNGNTFFNDPTGSRRFITIEVEKEINIKWVEENREQFFAQLKQDNSLKGWLTNEESLVTQKVNLQYTLTDDVMEFKEWVLETFDHNNLSEGFVNCVDIKQSVRDSTQPASIKDRNYLTKTGLKQLFELYFKYTNPSTESSECIEFMQRIAARFDNLCSKHFSNSGFKYGRKTVQPSDSIVSTSHAKGKRIYVYYLTNR